MMFAAAINFSFLQFLLIFLEWFIQEMHSRCMNTVNFHDRVNNLFNIYVKNALS